MTRADWLAYIGCDSAAETFYYPGSLYICYNHSGFEHINMQEKSSQFTKFTKIDTNSFKVTFSKPTVPQISQISCLYLSLFTYSIHFFIKKQACIAIE